MRRHQPSWGRLPITGGNNSNSGPPRKEVIAYRTSHSIVPHRRHYAGSKVMVPWTAGGRDSTAAMNLPPDHHVRRVSSRLKSRGLGETALRVESAASVVVIV